MNTYPISGTKILDYSDVTYGILRVNRSEIANFLPTLYYPITVHDNAKNKDYNKHMHLSVRNRIDGFTEIYKDNKVKEGDSIIMELHKEHENGNPKYVLKVSFKKNEIILNDQNKRQQRDEELRSELQEEILAIQGKIKECGAYFDSNETNVRAELVEYILNILGWSFPYLAREVKAGEKNSKVDIALFDGNHEREQCKALIETKALGVSYNEGHFEQLTKYFNYFSDKKNIFVPIGILTNGRTWILYRNYRDRFGMKLLKWKHIDIVSDDISDILFYFNRLRKENVDELIEEMTRELALEEHLYSESDKYINGSNIIIKYSDGSEDICGKNATDTFKLFIERHFDDVKRLQYEEFFDIISNDHPFSKFISINVGGKHWYINTNNDTQEKRSIIDYVIGRCDIKATTDYITK